MTGRIKYCVVLVFMSVCTTSFGRTILPGDFSGAEEIITFDPGFGPVYPGSIPSPYTVSATLTNVTFTSHAGNSNLGANGDFRAFDATPGASQGNALYDRALGEPSNLELEFSNNLFRVGMWVRGGNTSTVWTVSIRDPSDALIESAVFNYDVSDYPGPSLFVGFESSTPIASMMIVEHSENGQFTGINDLRFEVPEPATLSLLALGGLALVRRRKRGMCK